MSTAALVRVPTPRSRVQSVKWAMVHADTVGEAVELTHLQDRTVQLFGTWDSATVVIQGSNEATPTTWATLRDPAGNNLSFTADGLKAILELPRWIRPSKSGGAANDAVTVIINARGDTF